MNEFKVEVVNPGGGELLLSQMDEDSLMEMGRATYEFVRRLRRNPEYWAMVQAMTAKNQASAST